MNMSDKKSFSECSDTVGRIVIVVMVASILIGLCYLMYLSHVSYKQQRDAIDMIMTMNRMENMNNQDYENCYRVEAIIFKQTTNETTIIQYSDIFVDDWEAVKFGMLMNNYSNRDNITRLDIDIIQCACDIKQ